MGKWRKDLSMQIVGKRLCTLWVGVTLALWAMAAFAQTYPNKPIHFIVPYPPGGIVDVLGRVLGDRLSKAVGQSVIVENRPGAGGSLGTAIVAKSVPDGYTLLVGASAPLATGLSLYPNLNYDVMKDLTAVTLIANSDLVITANPGLPVASLKDLVSLARAKPGSIKVGVPSAGSMHHLIIEELGLKTNTKVILVPYKGEPPMLNDLLGGHLDIGVFNIAGAVPHIRQKALMPLVVTSRKRSELLPAVPTTAEAGYPGLVADPWFAIMAPGGTPKEVVNKLTAELTKILNSPEVKKRFTDFGVPAISSTPEQTSAFIADEIARWAKVVKDSGAKFE